MNKTEIANLINVEDGLSNDSWEDVEDGIIKDSVLKLTSNTFDDISPDEFVGASLRNRNIASQNDIEAEYKGLPTSRKSLSKDNNHNRNGLDDCETDSDDTLDSDNEIGSEDDDSSIADDIVNEGDDDDGDDNDGSGIEEDDDSDILVRKNEGERHVSKKRSKGEAVDNENSYNLYSKSVKNVAEDIEKGNAIRYQMSIWESLLECRIKLQKALAACNRLPQGNNLSSFLTNFSESDRCKISKTHKSIASLLQLLLNFQKEMIQAFPDFAINNTTDIKSLSVVNIGEENDDDNESISSSVASGFSDKEDEISNGENEISGSIEPPRKLLKLDDFARELKSQHETFIPARNQAIQKWNDKTRISLGRVKSSNFSAFDQSTLKQIEQILSDKNRLIKRTQTKRSVYNVIGKDENDLDKGSEQAVVIDPEIFDDDDFYHKLLREFIEQKSSDVTNPQQMGRQWVELQKMRSKMKRPIDVKATKGRRLRYGTHSKLVNFMAPIPYNSWTDEAESELFSSLFGEIREK